MSIRVFNDLTRQVETFVPLVPGKVGFYACGPTVYDYFHIGNARAFVVFDTVRRYLEYRGYDVTFVQNFTDIDDKMIKRAGERGVTVEELADEMIKAYFEDADALNLKRATVHPKATDHIPQIIEIVQGLIDKGFAYSVNGDVYYNVRDFKDYGKLSHKKLEDLEAGARIEVDERKLNPADFALWKAQKPGEPAWDSPWGKGRPGWHIECSAMARTYLGDTLDFHSGGEDLVFPHHENEIAQSEAFTGKPFVRYWVHNAFLNFEGEKMSKSLGNFFTVRDIRKHVDPQVIRFFLLSTHYRKPLNFSEEGLTSAQNGLERLKNAMAHAAAAPEGEPSDREQGVLLGHRRAFEAAMDDDFNTANAQTALFGLANDVFQGNAGRAALPLFIELGGVLGIRPPAAEALTAEEQALLDQRQAARKAKNWAEADRLRAELLARGIVIEDTAQGVRWKRK